MIKVCSSLIIKAKRRERNLQFVEADSVETHQLGRFDGSGGLELATNGERSDSLENGEGRTSLAGGRNVVDSNLVVREAKIVAGGGGGDLLHIELPQTQLSVVHHRFLT